MHISNLPKPADSQKAKIGRDLFKNEPEAAKAIAASIFGNSPYLARIIESEPDFFLDICKNGFDFAFSHLINNLHSIHPKEFVKQELMSFLRLAKRKLSLLVALADITGSWSLKQVTAALSEFADLAVSVSVECLLFEKYKNKLIESENPQESGLFVLAVGKLGARELNYSSDIDIMVFYDENRAQYIGKLSVREFFVRFTQELVEVLQTRNHEGYVFRTDLRIRPDPYLSLIHI
jgi:glutamate-ammonia-ligase adenylyltransferase